MTGVIATIPRIQFSNALGIPLAGGKLSTYLAGTNTPEPTYQDQDLTIANQTTITLDATGSCVLWLDPEKSYKFLLKSAIGVTQPGWPVDDISGAAAGTAQISFIQSGSGAIKRSLQGKLRDVVSLLDFGAIADGKSDIKAPLERAIASGKRVRIPDGEYFLSAPVEPVEGMALLGEAEIPVLKTGGAKIYAPNGFLKHAGERIRCQVYGLHIHGDAKLGVHGITGKMGGLIDGNCFEKFDAAVINQQSYLTNYRRNKFFACNRGLWLNETNTVNIEWNHFDGDVLIQIDNMTLTPGGAIAGGSGLNILSNNFNVTAITQAVARLTQAINFSQSNYVEVYEEMPAGVALIEYLADRFAYSTLVLKGNHIVGQNKCDRALRVYSSHTQGTEQTGEVAENWMRGFRLPPILVDNAAGKGRVIGIRYHGNQSTQTQAVEFGVSAVPHTQAMRATYTAGALAIDGNSFVTVPLTDAIPSMGADLSSVGGTAWKAGAPGLYHIEMSVCGKSTAADQLTQEAALQINGITVDQRFFPIVRNAAGGNRYANVVISGVYMLAANDVVAMAVRNGEVLHRATLSAYRIGDNCYHKPAV